MPSIVPGYEYDVFISYRQNDNRSGWVTKFVEDLRSEIAATIKEPVNIYFDENPHDGLQDTHHVDKSLENKLRCLIFIPILSHTYCDTKSFAWNNEFLPFCRMAKEDAVGMNVRLPNGNVTSRILPLQIHDLDARDQRAFELETGYPLRSIDFIFRSSGVNRPLTPSDSRGDNSSKTFYRDQINKTANAIEGILSSLVAVEPNELTEKIDLSETPKHANQLTWFWAELRRRNVIRAGITYIIVYLLLLQVINLLTPILEIEERVISLIARILAAGFPFALLLAWRYEISPRGVIRTTSEEAAANPYPPSRKKPLTGGPTVFVLISSLALSAVYVEMFIDPKPPSEGKLITIAVLPFENRNKSEADDYIAEGITDEIINRLTIISKLKVVGRKATHQYQGQTVPFPEISRNLEASIIVKGSMRRVGNQILVTAQLIDGPNDLYLWGDTFHRTTENFITFQTEIAKKIAEQLKVKLNELELLRLNKQATGSPTAYDYYLKGRSLYYKYSAEANDSAVQQFKMALAEDPEYASAWAGLADAFGQMGGRYGLESFWLDSGMRASHKAIALDSTLSDAYKSLANAHNYRKHYDRAFPLLQKSVELNPTNSQAVGNLGTNYLLRGDLPNAIDWEKKSAGMDPKNWIPYQLVGWTYRLMGDLSEAESWLRRSLEIGKGVGYDTYEHLGYTYVAQGRKNLALKLIPELLDKEDTNNTRVLEVAGLIANFAGDRETAAMYFQQSIEKNSKYKDDRNTYSPIGLGQIYLEQGKRVDAEVLLTQAMNNLMTEVDHGSQSADLPYYIASIYAIRGNREKALEWLQRAIDQGWVDYAMIEFGPYLKRYLQDSAFVIIATQLRKKTSAMRLIANSKSAGR